jgi:hypothetical protein
MRHTDGRKDELTRDEHDAAAVDVGLNVPLPDIVREKRGNGDLLGCARRRNGHEQLKSNEECAAGAQQVNCNSRGNKTCNMLVVSYVMITQNVVWSPSCVCTLYVCVCVYIYIYIYTYVCMCLVKEFCLCG